MMPTSVAVSRVCSWGWSEEGQEVSYRWSVASAPGGEDGERGGQEVSYGWSAASAPGDEEGEGIER